MMNARFDLGQLIWYDEELYVITEIVGSPYTLNGRNVYRLWNNYSGELHLYVEEADHRAYFYNSSNPPGERVVEYYNSKVHDG